MNIKFSIIIFFFILLHQSLYASYYFPNIYYLKPSKDDPYLTNISLNFTAGFANEAFNRQGESVPYLQQYGSEDFLWRFVDPSLGPDDLESAGQGVFSGKYHFRQYIFLCEKNIFHHLGIGMASAFQDISLTDITPRFLYDESSLLESQINYLEQLKQIIPHSISSSGMYTTIFYMSYNQKFTDFKHINHFQGYIFAGIGSPQHMSNDNHSVFQYPLSANIYFKYPIIGAINIGLTDYCNFGLTALVASYQQAQTTIPINKTGENNHLLFSQRTIAKIHQSPFFSGTIYIELKKPKSGITSTIVYSYSQYLESTITPLNTKEFPTAHANKSILLDGYNLGALLFELSIDRSSHEEKLSPTISLFFSMPVSGKQYQKVYLFGSTCGCQINYAF